RLERFRREAKYERSNVLCAETHLIRAKERLAAVGKPAAERKSGVTVVDGQGRTVELDPTKSDPTVSNLPTIVDDYSALVLGTCRADKTRDVNGKQYATAALWE